MDPRQDTVRGQGRMWLVVFQEGQPHHAVEVTGDRFVIGRDASCDLVLDDPRASRQHAFLSPAPLLGRTLHDLGSANGTILDGRPVQIPLGFGAATERVAEVRGGEVIQIGDTVMVVAPRDPGPDLRAGAADSSTEVPGGDRDTEDHDRG